MVEQTQDTHNCSKYKGKNSTKKQIKPPKKISARYLHNSGLAYLQRFPASSMHFRTIMMRKINKSCRHHIEQNHEECVCLLDELIVKFRDLGFLNDEAYLHGMVRSLRKRGLSTRQITHKLTQKGYESHAIDSAIKEHDTEEFDSEYNGDFYAALLFARRKKLGPFDIFKKRDPKKSLASMARAGYSYAIAKKIIEMNESEIPKDFI
jgi:regulatory protein